jgi:hypothetical protein
MIYWQNGRERESCDNFQAEPMDPFVDFAFDLSSITTKPCQIGLVFFIISSVKLWLEVTSSIGSNQREETLHPKGVPFELSLKPTLQVSLLAS